MFHVIEFDHPEHATYKWTKLECEWINERIRLAIRAEREACAMVCDDLIWALDHGGNKYKRPADAERCARDIRKRSNA